MNVTIVPLVTTDAIKTAQQCISNVVHCCPTGIIYIYAYLQSLIPNCT